MSAVIMLRICALGMWVCAAGKTIKLRPELRDMSLRESGSQEWDGSNC